MTHTPPSELRTVPADLPGGTDCHDDASRPSLKGYSLSVTVEDGYYLKAYANPPEGGGIVSWGFQATISRRGVRDSLKALVAAYLEDNGG